MHSLAGSTYVPERQSEYWTSREIENFFLNAGFECLVYPVPQRIERVLPADFIYDAGEPIKLFGIQYKALYRGVADHWRLTQHQHQTLVHFPWIYYGLSEIRSVRDARNSLHQLRVAPTQFTYMGVLLTANNVFYYRWGGFFQALQRCRVGLRLTSADHLRDLLSPPTTNSPPISIVEAVVDLFIVDFGSRRLVHVSPFLIPSDE
jgi:hypothetical protein